MGRTKPERKEKRMDALAAIHQRFSVRSYADKPVDSALLARLLSFAEKADCLTDVPPRVTLISGSEEVNSVLTFMVGSYGLIQNAPHLLVGIMPEEAERARVDLGYVLEQVVLEATRLGLGTCWVTGSYDPNQAAEVVSLAPGEVVAAVCAMGQAAEAGYGRFHTKVIRRLAGGHKRKPLTKLVYAGRWGEAWSSEEADPALVTVLEHARLAPSAHNAQPWRFILDDDRIVLAVTKPSFIDAGIVMSHVSLAAEAVELEGRWDLHLSHPGLVTRYSLPKTAIPVGTFQVSHD